MVWKHIFCSSPVARRNGDWNCVANIFFGWIQWPFILTCLFNVRSTFLRKKTRVILNRLVMLATFVAFLKKYFFMASKWQPAFGEIDCKSLSLLCSWWMGQTNCCWRFIFFFSFVVGKIILASDICVLMLGNLWKIFCFFIYCTWTDSDGLDDSFWSEETSVGKENKFIVDVKPVGWYQRERNIDSKSQVS